MEKQQVLADVQALLESEQFKKLVLDVAAKVVDGSETDPMFSLTQDEMPNVALEIALGFLSRKILAGTSRDVRDRMGNAHYYNIGQYKSHVPGVDPIKG